MLSEIGSNFWLDPNHCYCDKPLGTPSLFNCEGSDYVWLSTGRSAIKYVIKTIEYKHPSIKKIAILPSFTCDTVFDPFLKAGYEVYYYPVKNDLLASSDDILKIALEYDASIVLFHRYFGFDTLDRQVDKMCEILKGLGKYTIEDCTQCLYSDISRASSDFTIGSIRKWTGTPDGGFVVSRKGFLRGKPEYPDNELENAKIRASYAKYRFLFEQEGDKADMLAMYREAENLLDHQKEFYTISPMSAKVQANLDVCELTEKRRDNFNILSSSLCNQVKPLFVLDDKSVVPLYFPIMVDDRLSLQKKLVQNSIYAPVVWPKDDKQPKVCEGAEHAYQHLLCIPIDQRYDADDMNRIVDVINNFYKR